jgi:hypothetical protein
MTFQLTDDALDLAILQVLNQDQRQALTEPEICADIGANSGGVTAVVMRCLELQKRGLIYSVEQRFWKITTSGKLAVRKGVL